MAVMRSTHATAGSAAEFSVAARLQHAERLFTNGHADEARHQLEDLLVHTSDDPALRLQALTDLAVINARTGRLGEGAALALRALAEAPDHQAAREVLDFCATVRGQEVAAASARLQDTRAEEFRRLSTCVAVHGEPVRTQPVLMLGRGRISFGTDVQFGWHESPGFYDGYAYLEAAHPSTMITIGDNTFFNNGAVIRCEGPGVSVGADCLFGWSVQLLDSDFHDLDPRRRRSGTPSTGHIAIGDNVFVGSNTIVMKGVTIGDDSVIGAGSIVLHSIPAGVIAGGNPARVIRPLEP
jgi:acetyltransferase-like isoleucine patch superfamily enzyme